MKENNRYKKYQWIELEIDKNPKDPRPETYRPRNIDDIILGESIPTDRNWEERRNFILSQNPPHTNLKTIIDAAKNNEYSLAIFKPKQIKSIIVKKVDRECPLIKKEAVEAASKQLSLPFQETYGTDFKLIPKLPYKFSYRFTDDEDKESTLMIVDWEIGQLYWNCLKKEKCEQAAIAKVKQKYFNNFALTKDLHLFLGTTREWHNRGKNPYVIIGTFHPPHILQKSLLF